MEATPDRDQTTPEAFGPSHLRGGDTLVLAGPGLKTSSRVETVAAESTCDVADGLETDTDGPLIIDEFSRAWRAGSPKQRDAFRNRLRGETPTHVVGRPYAIEWLIQAEHVSFGREDLGEFDRILSVQYGEGQERAAVNRCLELSVHDDSGALSEAALLAEIDQLRYSYEFDAEPLAETVGKYESVIPQLVGYLSLSGKDEKLFQRAVEAATEAMESFTLSESLSDAKDAAFGLFSDESELFAPEMAVGSGTAVLGGPLGTGMALLLWVHLRTGDDGLDETELLHTLAGTATTPVARAKLEADVGLPPRTLDDLNWLLRRDGLAEVRRVCRAAPDRASEFSDAVADHDDRLGELEATIERLETETRVAEALYSDHVRNATRGLETVEKQLAENEATLLSPLVSGGKTVDIADVPYVTGESDDEGPPTAEAIERKVRDHELVVLQGPSGTGKTTAAYRAGRRLESSAGDAVLVPNLGTLPPSFVERAIEQFVKADRIFLYVSYGVGEGQNVIDERALGTLK